ncbi:MAG: HhoA/HhoB/HtrA family serine endopeptidase [cyanobacterium endosymbiont of Rhopalodia musculus]|uniref:HhoA/HhoB/HtrA family serine endopeptidase n=1 Tax=cyanobacterium endosymbiont of Epithemia clementina EcSB TaxID=3034674 RepID=UPI00248019B9|nr:HhoA/HhoB/HtrA family serine endopeptidase [cyanobacterium endosymbiont of Epithemia clementina EcSB]WGT67832.1 HhoA/HhoB/HtrA family serine endopeptidase [cyanobacterium endosymbiont of Epithemia clementina EcSB]
MKFTKLLRQLGSCLISLLLGMLLCFGGFHFLSSQAEPFVEPSLNDQENISAPLNLAKVIVAEDRDNFVSAAVARTGSAVVRIDTETVVTRSIDPFFNDPFFREFFGEQFRSRLPQEQRIAGQGSGFIIDENGIILTNAHVVNKADKVTVTLKDGRTFNGQVRGTDEVTDLAVVKISAQEAKLPVAPLGDSANLKVGDWAIAVGNPVGLDNTVTLGIISTIGRSAAKAGIPDKRLDFIQTDAAINPGNSGGPLLNSQGEVIGINTAIRADAMGIGFAIPINKAKALQNILVSGEKVPHPYIGVQMVNLTPELARENNKNSNSPILIPEVEGILVVQVVPNTPAARAGIRRGDVIVGVNGKLVTDGSDLQSIVENSGLNASLKLQLYRGDRVIYLTVKTAQLQGTP